MKIGSFEMKNISFTVEKGDYFVILGESGIGKSVLLETLAGIIPLSGGSLSLKGHDISHTDIQSRKLGLVYQDQALFPHLNVKNNIAFPLKARGLSKEEISNSVKKLADDVGISKHLRRFPETLSLGEAQRTALARTMASNPEILLLDEPLASLDIQAKTGMRTLLRRLNKEGQTIIHVTHDYEEAISLASKIAILENGTISQVGTPDEIFRHPKTSFIANFVGIRNFFRGTLKKQTENLGIFTTDNLQIEVATDSDDGTGNLIIKSEYITISKSSSPSSARNIFQGIITDIEPARLGVEITVDIGNHITVLITRESMEKMKLKIGTEVWISFKATSVKFLPVNEYRND